jgi:hypothetical protein
MRTGSRFYKDYADYIVNHQRKPGIGPLSGWRGENGDKTGRGEAQPGPARALHREWRLLEVHVPEEAQYFKHANRAWSDWAIEHGTAGRAGGEHFQLYLEPLRKFQLAAEGKIKPVPPEHHRARISDLFRSAANMVSAVCRGRAR